MNNKEVITFSLKTTSIDSSVFYTDYFGKTITTNTGIVTNNRCNYKWFNINLRNILGDEIYQKYNKFNLSLNTVTMSSQGSSTTMTPDARTLYIKMSGLPWLSSYGSNSTSSNSSTFAILNVIQVPTTPGATYLNNINNPQILSFTKNSENVTINIVLHSVEYDLFDTYADATQLFGQFGFIFSIIPIIEDDINIERNRINIK